MKQRRLTRKEIKAIKEESEVVETIESDITQEQILKALPINLELAGIFFVSAYMNFVEGERHYKKLIKEIDKYKTQYTKRISKYDMYSDECTTYLQPRIRNIEIFYEPVVRHFSLTKILLVCSVETYINEIAGLNLNGRKLDEFDKLSVVGKWLFIPEVLKIKKKFSVDKNPLQDFSILVKERNALVHFKGAKRTLKNLEIPNFIEDLRLTPKDCKRNLQAVEKLMCDLNLSWKGSYGQDWLYVKESHFRNPCFFLGNRLTPVVLYSDIYDKGRL